MQSSVEELLSQVLDKVVNDANNEDDNYKKALLLRIKTSIES